MSQPSPYIFDWIQVTTVWWEALHRQLVLCVHLGLLEKPFVVMPNVPPICCALHRCPDVLCPCLFVELGPLCPKLERELAGASEATPERLPVTELDLTMQAC